MDQTLSSLKIKTHPDQRGREKKFNRGVFVGSGSTTNEKGQNLAILPSRNSHSKKLLPVRFAARLHLHQQSVALNQRLQLIFAYRQIHLDSIAGGNNTHALQRLGNLRMR